MSAVVVDRPIASAVDDGGAVAAPAPRRTWWVRPGRPRWSLPARAGLTVLAALLYTWDLVAQRHGQHLLRRRGEERHRELEGVPLRLARPRQFHHRGQAPRRVVGDGALGPDIRVLDLEHAPAAGRRRGGDGTGPLPRGAAMGRRGPGPAGRAGPGAHPDRRGHVPLQQSRRLAGPLVGAVGVGTLVGPGDGKDLEAGGLRHAAGAGLHHQDAPGVRRAAGLRPGLSLGRAAQARPSIGPAAVGRTGTGGVERVVGGPGRTVAQGARGRTSAGARTTPS